MMVIKAVTGVYLINKEQTADGPGFIKELHHSILSFHQDPFLVKFLQQMFTISQLHEFQKALNQSKLSTLFFGQLFDQIS